MYVTEGSSSNTQCLQRLEEEGVVPLRRRGARGRRDDAEPDVEHQPVQENMVDDGWTCSK